MSSRPSEPGISRINVDSEADWLKIRDNVERSMRDSMELRLATLPGGRDGAAAKAVRAEVESRLMRIRDEMFDLAKPNLRINGYPYETFIEATEPFDEALDRKIWILAAERAGFIAEVAGLRKTVPGQIQTLEKDLDWRQTANEWMPEGEDEEDPSKSRAEVLPPPPRHEEVKQTFKTVVSNISELVQTAPTQVQRAQRAQNVREEIAKLPR